MRVTTKGQVTIPIHIRERLAITPETEIDFVEDNGRFYLVRKVLEKTQTNRFAKFRGIINTTGMSTEEIMRLTRNPE